MKTLTGNFRFPRNTRIVHDWLPYGPGYTARKRLGGNDILSGYFTGCLMTLWQERLSGNWYVGHVGTNQDVEVDNRVKSTFGNSMPQGTMGFTRSGPGPVPARSSRSDTNSTATQAGYLNSWVWSRLAASSTRFSCSTPGSRAQTRFVVGGTKLVQPMNSSNCRGVFNLMPQRPLPLTPSLSRLGRRLIPG